ncbi:CrcB protein [Desulfocicer vacuolatum DSM 3385]|uniref:Fluoride-specific ion channel FluC n=1 Tax=Desulfocicer vacuolatum DSM 3385 TaxID=1121400 RepID=A0A1W2B943_9BACT|nr:CrcB family protein [Desulfocicer vacuolatum]SMC69456.1 CrcB protein [Desulfocicer vacuolatum DSM 3385]
MLQKLFCIALGGALGTLARYGLSGAVQKWLGSDFPWGTAAVNILGSFLFGLLWAFAMGRGNLNTDLRSMLFVGFLGAFTTFSTFISETGQLMAASQILMGMGNVMFQLLVGAGMFFVGMALGRAI